MTVALLLAGCFAGFLVSATTGVGGAITLLPLLALVFPAPIAVALTSPVMLASNAGKLVLFRASLDRGFLRRTLLGAVPGAVAGSLLLGVIPDGLVRRGIGLFLLGYVAVSVLAPTYLPKVGRLGAVGWGVITGFVSGLVGAGGPTSTAAMRGYGIDRAALVATGAAISVGLQLVKLPVLAAVGLLRASDVPLLLALCATALAAAWVGRALLRHMDARTFERILLAALFGLGLLMLCGPPAGRPYA